MIKKEAKMIKKEAKMIKKEAKRKGRKKMVFVKKLSFFLFLCLFFVVFHTKSSVFHGFYKKSQSFPEIITNFSFKNGENLKYKISYGQSNRKGGILLAGYAHFNLKDSTINDSKNVYRIRGFGGSTKFFSFFMNVKHSYSSIVDTKTLQTIESKMEITEGRYYNKNQTICDFDSIGAYNCDVEIIRKKNKIIQQNKSGANVLKNVDGNDILGAFYKLRTMHPNNVNDRDTVFFSYYYNNDVFDSHFINLGEEVLETKFGKIKTIKCAPLLEIGRMFKEEYGAFVWVTDDDMHIPVKLEMPILVGSVYVTLVEYENTLFDLKE